jgi:cytochrome c oxidase cbb3-type subunit IV
MSNPEVQGVMTAVLLLGFLGILIWAFSRKRRADFDAAALLPLIEEPPGNLRSVLRGEEA